MNNEPSARRRCDEPTARRSPVSSLSASASQRRASCASPTSAHARPIARSPCQTVACEWRPSTSSGMSDE